MAFVFDPDVSSPTFNAYCTVDFAKTYQDSKMNSSFLALPDATIQRLLVWATRQINTLQWKGTKTNIEQVHEFPRNYLWRDGNSYSTTETFLQSSMFDPTTIPLFVQEMCADICGSLAIEDITEDTALTDFKRLKVDVIEVEAAEYSSTAWLPSSSRQLAWRYLLNSSKYTVRTQRVG